MAGLFGTNVSLINMFYTAVISSKSPKCVFTGKKGGVQTEQAAQHHHVTDLKRSTMAINESEWLIIALQLYEWVQSMRVQ